MIAPKKMILIIVILNVTWTYFVFCTSMLPAWQKGELNYKEIRKKDKVSSFFLLSGHFYCPLISSSILLFLIEYALLLSLMEFSE